MFIYLLIFSNFIQHKEIEKSAGILLGWLPIAQEKSWSFSSFSLYTVA